MVSRVLLLFLTLVPLILMADEEAADDALRMSVKPSLCIVDKNTPSCRMSFLVVWESTKVGYYCLFNDFGEAPVRCWQEARTGRAEDERVVQADFQYWMSDDRGEQKLALAQVEVLRMDSNDRRRKRRTRHVWDLN